MMKKLLLALLAVPTLAQACQLDPHQGQYTNSVYNDSAEEKVISNGVEYKGEELQPLVFVNESPKVTEPKVALEEIKIDAVEPKSEAAQTFEIKDLDAAKAPEVKAEVKDVPKTAPDDALLIEEITLNKDAMKTADSATKAPVKTDKTAEDALLEEIRLELEKLDAADADKTASIFDEEIEVAPAK